VRLHLATPTLNAPHTWSPRSLGRARALEVLGSLADGLATLALLVYPVAVYAAMRGRGPRFAALLLLAFVAPLALLRMARWRASRLSTLALVPVVAAVLLVASAALDRAGYALLVPTAVASMLLITFGASLFAGPPMVERFARLQHDDLRPDEVAWCRLWTVIWCGFFVVNGSIAAALTAWGDTRLWAIYNGAVAYAAMGTLFAVEWVMRKLRFGRLTRSPVDRLFARLRGERSGAA